MTQQVKPSVKDLPVHLDRDLFTRVVIRELSGTLQDVVGIEDASGFISLVGQKIGERINQEYQEALALIN
jgi:hypothetical protein